MKLTIDVVSLSMLSIMNKIDIRSGNGNELLLTAQDNTNTVEVELSCGFINITVKGKDGKKIVCIERCDKIETLEETMVLFLRFDKLPEMLNEFVTGLINDD